MSNARGKDGPFWRSHKPLAQVRLLAPLLALVLTGCCNPSNPASRHPAYSRPAATAVGTVSSLPPACVPKDAALARPSPSAKPPVDPADDLCTGGVCLKPAVGTVPPVGPAGTNPAPPPALTEAPSVAPEPSEPSRDWRPDPLSRALRDACGEAPSAPAAKMAGGDQPWWWWPLFGVVVVSVGVALGLLNRPRRRPGE